MNAGNVFRKEEKEIDGVKVECTVFAGLQGLKLKARLLKIIGPAIGKGLKGFSVSPGKSILDSVINMELIGEALSGLAENIDDPKVIDLIQELVSQTQYEGKVLTKDVFNIVFAGDYLILYKIILFVIDANRFFGQGVIGNLFASDPMIPKIEPKK